jgi:hypothetical protein
MGEATLDESTEGSGEATSMDESVFALTASSSGFDLGTSLIDIITGRRLPVSSFA